MVQVLLPARLLQEAAACAVLGAALGAARAFLPVRGRAAFAPDVLLSGAVLLACQSYAAGYSAAGVLRWYMVAAAFAAALCTAGVLGVPLRALGRGIRAVLRRFAVQPVRRRRAADGGRHRITLHAPHLPSGFHTARDRPGRTRKAPRASPRPPFRPA